MTLLPASIESHLREVGFTATEVIVLRHASDGGPFSIRQLATKVGKSTGALDQATKKLLSKGILKREIINSVPRYMLASADAIAFWVQGHTNETLSMLKRKENDVRLFFSSVTLNQDRPCMEYFDGEEGIKKAYQRILDAESDEILILLPMTHKEEDDYLRSFRKTYTQKRRQKNVHCRVLAHATPLGLRYQSRDVFEQRKTVLVPENLYPFNREQVIAGETYTSFDHETNQACMMYFPSFSASQRAIFESIWNQYQEKSDTQDKMQNTFVPSLDFISLAELEGALAFA